MQARLIALAALLPLSACGTDGTLDICKYAEVRRATYTATIVAADAAIANGQGNRAVLLGRTAAETALTILNTNCPLQ